jgi:phosphatidylserine/phosphatidylglycerophosphate/cardiolipin synthase-like enzyme
LRAQVIGQPIVEPDDGRQPLLDAIGQAQSSIDLAIYELTDSQTVTALEDAAGRGVAVRVLAEPLPGGRAANVRTIAALAKKGVQTRDSSPSFRLTHEKAMVIDGSRALIMSLNLVAETFHDTRDAAITDTDASDVAEIESVFQADWDRSPVTVSDPALVWSPDNARARLLGLLESANTTLDIYAEELTDRQVIAALTSAVDRGVSVRLLMTDTGSHDPARPGRSQLVSRGAQVRLLSKPFVHAKVVIADGATAFAGSENFTAQSMDDNRELGLRTSDPQIIGRLSSVFDQDWTRANPAP